MNKTFKISAQIVPILFQGHILNIAESTSVFMGNIQQHDWKAKVEVWKLIFKIWLHPDLNSNRFAEGNRDVILTLSIQSIHCNNNIDC